MKGALIEEVINLISKRLSGVGQRLSRIATPTIYISTKRVRRLLPRDHPSLIPSTTMIVGAHQLHVSILDKNFPGVAVDTDVLRVKDIVLVL